GAKPLCLVDSAARQFAAADTSRKSEVVLDLRTAARLTAGRVAIEQQRAQPFRRAVHGGGKTGGPRASDYQVVEVRRHGKRSTEVLGDLSRVRIAQRPAVFEDQRRQFARLDSR